MAVIMLHYAFINDYGTWETTNLSANRTSSRCWSITQRRSLEECIIAMLKRRIRTRRTNRLNSLSLLQILSLVLPLHLLQILSPRPPLNFLTGSILLNAQISHLRCIDLILHWLRPNHETARLSTLWPNPARSIRLAHHQDLVLN